RGGRGRAAGAVPGRGRRPPDPQRRVPGRARRRAPAARGRGPEGVRQPRLGHAGDPLRARRPAADGAGRPRARPSRCRRCGGLGRTRNRSQGMSTSLRRRMQDRGDLAHAADRVHFIGIGGTGMSGLAEVLGTLGYTVSGSDRADNAVTRRLQGLGIKVHQGHDAAHVAGTDCVVVSSAIRPDNPELVEARARRIPVVPRAEMLAELMRFKRGVAIAGTHGKTTTTSLTASVLAEGGLDPTFVIGGQLLAAGANARLGHGHWLVAEADESDGSFLRLNPLLAIVTNIDADHLEDYGGDFARVQAAFSEFLHRLPFYGLAVLCLDDPNVAALAADMPRHVMTYGFAGEADVRAQDVVQDGARMRFTLCLPDGTRTAATLALPGRHNVQNALAAATVGWQ